MWTLDDLDQALGTERHGARREKFITGVSIDSRTIKPGDVFFAVRGLKLDGHQFLSQAREKGAHAFVVERKSLESARNQVSDNVWVVEDATAALGKFARYHRKKHAVRVAGMTGSCGKTTTRQMAAMLLRRKYTVLANEGNLNNHFGLPLTLFRLNAGHEAVMAELGASQAGEIAYLCGILEPHVGLITNIYPAHMEGYGSIDRMIDAELELADSLEQAHGTLAVHGDCEELLERARRLRVEVISFGRKAHNDFSVTAERPAGDRIEFEINGRYRISLKTRALFNVDNFLAAFVLAHAMGVPYELLEGEAGDFSPPPGRFELLTLPRELAVINDSYNANPGSMLRGLESFSSCENVGARKIAVLADMLELGEGAAEFHRQVGREMKRFHIPVLVTVGRYSREIAREASGIESYSFDNNSEAISFLDSFLQPGDALFLKGSHSMRLEEILVALQNRAPSETAGRNGSH